MSWTLFKATLKANWILGVVFVLIVLIYVTTSASMFDPVSAESIQAMLDLLPEGMTRAMGFAGLGTDLTAYLANYLYGFIMVIFPLIYSVVVANRLIAKHVDSGSLAYLLTTPITRVRIATTQAVYLAVSLLFIFVVAVVVAFVIAESMFASMLDVGRYVRLNVVAYLALLAGAGVSYLSSCSFSDTRHSLAFGAGIPLVFLVARMISKISDEVAWARYLSLYSFIDVERLLADPGYAVASSAILFAVSLALFAAAVVVFKRRSLAL